MQTELLRVFREVAHRGSITTAARALRYTQSTVSRQIAALELEFGARLLDRMPRGIALTEEGRVLLGHAEMILTRLDDARRDVHAIADASMGRLRVAAFATAMVTLVPRALARVKITFPAVELSLVEGLSARLIEQLVTDEADVAVISCAADQPINDARLELHHLLDEQLLVALPLGHPLAGAAGTVGLAALADQPWVAGGIRPQESLLAIGMRHGFEPRIDFVANEWFAKLGLVAAGFGITLLPALAARAAPPDLALLGVDPDEMPPRKVYAATPAGRTRSALTEAFLSALRAEVQYQP
ncbi:LysR family transcriptional regulator [Actinoplanes sp. NPDC020271]|uniref:LysR family transcriptional regulator n=1 Tax=Actinoplanes sp. NPDC020271 TaxID=3363896 RepID=UPI0037B42FA9